MDSKYQNFTLVIRNGIIITISTTKGRLTRRREVSSRNLPQMKLCKGLTDVRHECLPTWFEAACAVTLGGIDALNALDAPSSRIIRNEKRHGNSSTTG